MIEMIGFDHRNRTAIANPERFHAHALIADAHAAITQNAARLVVKHHRRPLLFVDMLLLFQEPALAHPVTEGHVLQLALAALVAHRAIQWMVGEQELERASARFVHLGRIGMYHHALGHRQRAAHLELGRFFHFHQTHAASGLQSETVVIAKRWNLDAHRFGGVDHQRSGRGRHGSAVDREMNLVAHGLLVCGGARARGAGSRGARSQRAVSALLRTL